MKLGKLSRRATAAAIGGALALTGVGVSAAAVLSSPSTETVSDQTEVTEPTPTTSSEAAPTTEATQPVEQPAQEPQPTTVGDVNEQPAPAPDPTPVPQPDPADTGIGTTGPDGNYTPAPPPERPGQPPMGTIAPEPPAPKLPGEPGYEPPTG